MDELYQTSGDTDISQEDDQEHTTISNGDTSQSSANDDDGHEHPEYFRNQTQFYNHISNPIGRAKISRFPMVLALYDALQIVGYHAEADLDGNIWYGDDDGDRYFDALENIPLTEDGNAVPETEFLRDMCPICQDFPGYGLGHILEKAEDAKRQLYEYREKVRVKMGNMY